MAGSAGDAGHTSYLSKTDQKEYRDADESQRKMAEPLENERQAVKSHEPAGVVSVAVCTALLGLAFFLSGRVTEWDGLPLGYLYVGAIVPTALLLLRQALDFTYKEELLMNTLSDYVEHVRTWVEEVPAAEKPSEAEKEEIVEHIAGSIRQTAAAGSHFSRMLSPEEEEIMREIIREFME